VEGDIEDFSPAEKARFEMVLTGLTFSGHPISFLRPELSKRGVISSSQLEKCMDEDGLSDITVFSEAQQKFAKTIFGRYALIVEGRLQKFYPRSFAIVAEKVTPLTLK
jgi:phenylacetate-coenzyme A ligase PaaK-like adenylate-forming protein